MDRSTDPTVEEILAGIEKMRGAEVADAVPAPPPSPSDTPVRALSTDTFSMGAKFRHGLRPVQPATTLEEHVRTAMLAAADAIVQPWLAKELPRILDVRLAALVNERMEQFATTLHQRAIDAVNERLEPALKQRVAAVEQGLASAVPQQVADAFNQRFEPAVSKHVAAVEERVTTALSQQVARAVEKRLELAIGQQIAAIEQRMAAAVHQQVKEQLRLLFERFAAE